MAEHDGGGEDRAARLRDALARCGGDPVGDVLEVGRQLSICAYNLAQDGYPVDDRVRLTLRDLARKWDSLDLSPALALRDVTRDLAGGLLAALAKAGEEAATYRRWVEMLTARCVAHREGRAGARLTVAAVEGAARALLADWRRVGEKLGTYGVFGDGR
jgi:hypothetical protein